MAVRKTVRMRYLSGCDGAPSAPRSRRTGAARLPDLAGPEPRPALLHGDAQQNNFVSTAAGAVVIDAAPYFGHPEADLALVG